MNTTTELSSTYEGWPKDEWVVEREIGPSFDRGMVEIHDYGPWHGDSLYRARVVRYLSIADDEDNQYGLPVGEVQANEVIVEAICDGRPLLYEDIDVAYFTAFQIVEAVGPISASELMIARAKNGRAAK